MPKWNLDLKKSIGRLHHLNLNIDKHINPYLNSDIILCFVGCNEEYFCFCPPKLSSFAPKPLLYCWNSSKSWRWLPHAVKQLSYNKPDIFLYSFICIQRTGIFSLDSLYNMNSHVVRGKVHSLNESDSQRSINTFYTKQK